MTTNLWRQQSNDSTHCAAATKHAKWPSAHSSQHREVFDTVGFKTDGTLWAWGYNAYGQLGDGTTTDRWTPRQVGTDSNWASASAGTLHTVAVKTNGTLWTWGDNEYGQLGDGTITNRSRPAMVGTDTNWGSVSGGCYHTVGLKTDGTLWAWGYNLYGELGDGITTNRSVPVQGVQKLTGPRCRLAGCTPWPFTGEPRCLDRCSGSLAELRSRPTAGIW